MTEMTTSEVLNRAADLVEERGWSQGPIGWADWSTSEGLCLEGGLMAATGLNLAALYQTCPAYSAVADYLGLNPLPVIYPIKDTLWAWNDAPDRTAAEVIEVLRACAVIEASRERETAEAVR